jgi:uncharacterized protein YndB with AHSA1/START domain
MIMAAGKPRAARVFVSYSQYYVQAGLDRQDGGVGADLIPGLLTGLGPQEMMVITGLQTGKITVTARALSAPPPELEPGWDVVGETDLESPEGQISVVDWAGPGHPELGPLAISGPGRYRVRVHARNRDGTANEEHLLLLWPSTEPAATRLLTTLDECGLERTGQDTLRPLDELDQAAATAIDDLAALLAQPGPPAWSGSRTEVRAHAVVPATPGKVWTVISDPKWWLGIGGTGSLEDGGSFIAQLAHSPDLQAEGTFLVHERPKRLVLTWSWTTYREIEVDRETPYAFGIDPATGEVKTLSRTVRSHEHVPSWPLPVEGQTEIEIQLRGDRKGNTAVAVEHRHLPEELAEPMQSFWAWALRALLPWLTDAPLNLPPWAR